MDDQSLIGDGKTVIKMISDQVPKLIGDQFDRPSNVHGKTVPYWLKLANFSHPLSFSTLVRGNPFQIYGKASRFLKLESSRQPTVKIS